MCFQDFYKMIKVGLNGFGRIGRAITRILAEKRNFKIIVINEIDEDVENLAYLLKYDSIYGKFKGNIKLLNYKTNKSVIKVAT